MTENNLLSFFPITDKIKEVRSNQKEAIEKIETALNKKSTQITLCAPVGAGKSAIADTVFNYFKEKGMKCLYTSPLNALVDQVETSGFEGIVTLKGRKHYDCLAGKEDCSKGFCQSNKCPAIPNSSYLTRRECKNRPYDKCHRCVCNSCIYKAAFIRFKNCIKGNTNFTLFMMGVTNSPEVIVFDEADKVEDEIRNFHGVTIPILINDSDFMNHLKPLAEYQEYLYSEAEKIDLDKSEEKAKRRDSLIELSNKILMLLSDFEQNGEPWVIVVKPLNQKTKYLPVTIDRFLEPLLKDKIVVMMSATPPSYPGFSRIEVDSIFPIETRQWIYKPLGKMSMNYRHKTIPKLALFLSKLQGKTIVHCHSYKVAETISIQLKHLEINPLIQVSSNGNCEQKEDIVSRYDAVNAFITAKDPNKILLSVNLGRGIDLPQPEILNNVIAVMPWPNPTEPLTKAKDKYLGKGWHNELMAQEIQQQYGRIHRNEKMGLLNGIQKAKRTYIVDSNFGFWYSQNKKLFSKWFRESQLK